MVLLMCIVLLSSITLSASESCGSASCSQEYSASCPPDTSAYLYDNIMLTKSECNKPIEPIPADSLSSVDCYDTCIKSYLYFGIPLEACADLMVHVPGVMSVKNDAETSNVVIGIYPPAVESNFYQPNKFCKYNIRCPNETYMLHYTVVQIDIEPPDALNGRCLDFLRFSFSITGENKISDLCGTHKHLPDDVMYGYHGSHLTLDFRSNRIHSSGGFFLGMACVLPESTMAQPKTTNKNSYGLQRCSSSRHSSTNKQTMSTANEFFDKVFPGSFISRYDRIVTRGGVVKYKNKQIVVEHNGRILRRLRGIKRLQVHNRIEGYLNFVGSSSPSGRTFPGYGFLRVGWTGIAQYVQTIVDPKYLLTDAEEEMVRKLFEEHYNRRKLKNYYPKTRLISNKICGINKLAKLNIASCSVVVRAVANFFLETDPLQDFCYPSIR